MYEVHFTLICTIFFESAWDKLPLIFNLDISDNNQQHMQHPLNNNHVCWLLDQPRIWRLLGLILIIATNVQDHSK
jgi:hypothetical protein